MLSRGVPADDESTRFDTRPREARRTKELVSLLGDMQVPTAGDGGQNMPSWVDGEEKQSWSGGGLALGPSPPS